MKMIVGLGNPGKEYDKTRHNVGFMILDYLNLDFKVLKKFQAEVCIMDDNGVKIIYVKPLTFMNSSGFSVSKIASYYDILPEDILVIHDDMDIDLGHFKIKNGGGSAGHNGIKSIIQSLGSNSFARLRVGIGHAKEDTIDYVLGHFNENDLTLLQGNFDIFKDIIGKFLVHDVNYLMNHFNGL